MKEGLFYFYLKFTKNVSVKYLSKCLLRAENAEALGYGWWMNSEEKNWFTRKTNDLKQFSML